MVSYSATYEQAGIIFAELDEYQLRGCAGVKWDGSTIIVIPNGNGSTPYLHLERCVEINVNSPSSAQWFHAIRVYRSLYPGMGLMEARIGMMKLLEQYRHIKFTLSLS